MRFHQISASVRLFISQARFVAPFLSRSLSLYLSLFNGLERRETIRFPLLERRNHSRISFQRAKRAVHVRSGNLVALQHLGGVVQSRRSSSSPYSLPRHVADPVHL